MSKDLENTLNRERWPLRELLAFLVLWIWKRLTRDRCNANLAVGYKKGSVYGTAKPRFKTDCLRVMQDKLVARSIPKAAVM